MTHNEKIVEAVARAIKGAIKVDASGLAPAVIGHYVTGFDEAARAAITAYQAEAWQVNEDCRKALKTLLDHVDRETCTHEDTHRGGFIWTICDQCGRKWADDEGGFVPYSDPPAVAKARFICEAASLPPAPKASP